ncbi:MAG: N-acetylneuraminate synthase family protein, partial [Candidatus Firestonebacteria bacterium]|nr:N-acetylneuraminate synthase family protein [Candidatus Firestonebacteria bacterium]
ELFECEVGLSDHTIGVGVALASIALGATIIEKHFTLSRKDSGVDSAFSMEPQEMQLLVEESKRAWQGLGRISYSLTEKESVKFRRSIYIVEDTKKGEKFTIKNSKIIRPGSGLSPKYYEIILSKKASCNIEKGTPMKWEFLA